MRDLENLIVIMESSEIVGLNKTEYKRRILDLEMNFRERDIGKYII